MNIYGIYLALAILLIVLLAMNISRLRISEKIANGDGGNRKLIKAIRAHMNTLEHIVPFSLLLFFLDSQSLSSLLFSSLAFGFLAIRFLHSYSMLSSKFRLRQMTAALTYFAEVVACLLVLVTSVA
ncbi:MAG: MAPEG family protein [Marinobacter sp.]|uniref:MAPEG family protein n=1 Tax=Marinobacter sp. TaxID=50741 RepID=UPI00299E0A79|nr:MAPEG family protein [Marinobacter sp.]MDX1755709.1 MAPEG family protein [Marinobacter sp.]